MKATKDFTLRLPIELHKELKEIADNEYISLTVLIRQILAERVKQQ